MDKWAQQSSRGVRFALKSRFQLNYSSGTEQICEIKKKKYDWKIFPYIMLNLFWGQNFRPVTTGIDVVK